MKMEKNPDTFKLRMRRSTFEILLIGLASFLILIPFYSILDEWLIWPSMIGIGVFLLLIFTASKWKSEEVTATIFLLAIGYLTFVIGNNHEYYVKNLEIIQPYVGLKLMILVIAWIAPPVQIVGWTSLIGIGAFASFQYFSWDAAHRARMGMQEPMVTYIVLFCGMALYKNRLKVFSLIQTEAEYRTRSTLLTRFAGLLICAKHLSSTPIQTLEFIFANLRVRFPIPEEETSMISESLEKLRQIDEAMYLSDLPINMDEIQLPLTIEDLKNSVSITIHGSKPPKDQT